MLKFKNALAIFCPFELKFAVCEYINGIKENGIGQECSHFMKKGAGCLSVCLTVCIAL